MEQNQTTGNQTDLLQEYNEATSFSEASQGQRFANYIIDLICFYILVFLGGIILGIIIYAVNPQSTWLTDSGDNDLLSKLLDRLLGLFLYGIFMSLIEGLFKGRSLGKLITGTKAVRNDGGNFTWKDAFSRGISRMVPFEPFSALGGNPWHDRWTDTKVVQIRK